MVKFIQPDGHMAKRKVVGYTEYNSEWNGYDIIIDGKPYTWSELEKNVSQHESWKNKIEFKDIGEELD